MRVILALLTISCLLLFPLVGVEKKETYVPPSYDYMPRRHHSLGPYYYSVNQYTHTLGIILTINMYAWKAICMKQKRKN